MTASPSSFIYRGWVRHRRHAPTQHAFRYRVCMLYLDLERLDHAFAGSRLFAVDRPALASFRQADHLGDAAQPLHVSVRDLVEADTGIRPTGGIRLLTHPRYFGYVMNPVSFYYCFDPAGEQVQAIVAEINNTPWGERHNYVLRATDGDLSFQFGKTFHVSPFMPMDLEYDWRFTAPDRRLAVHMVNKRDGAGFFDATMVLERQPMTARTLRRALIRYPAMTAQVIAAIYWQALRLRIKKTPYFEHPERTA